MTNAHAGMGRVSQSPCLTDPSNCPIAERPRPYTLPVQGLAWPVKRGRILAEALRMAAYFDELAQSIPCRRAVCRVAIGYTIALLRSDFILINGLAPSGS